MFNLGEQLLDKIRLGDWTQRKTRRFQKVNRMFRRRGLEESKWKGHTIFKFFRTDSL